MSRSLRGPAKMLLVPLLSCLPSLLNVGAFDLTANTNLAVYWGQNSHGSTHPNDTANWQKPLGDYCQDTIADMIPIASLDQFYNVSGLPSINPANTRNISNDVSPGTALANFSAGDIQTCQSAGKAVTLSIGGANGGPAFANDTQAAAFAHTVWDNFLGGSSATRPFGNAVLDGINMGIQGGDQNGSAAFLTTLRDLMGGDNKPYYITTAAQCAYPDSNNGSTLNAFPFDAVFVDFDNSSCGLDHYDTPDWNFGVWDNWAKTISPNPNVKVYIGAPTSSSSALPGYVNASTLATIIAQTMGTYTSFGGVALWDASQAYTNNRYDVAVKNALTNASVTTTTIRSASLLKRDVSCDGILQWQMNVTYTIDQQVTYNGHLWTASSSSYNDAPGGAVGIWADNGLCTEPGSTTTSAAPTSTPTSCAEILAWQPNVAYTGGQQVSYNGQIWVAKYWSYNDVPGGTAGVWTDLRSCTASSLTCVGVLAWQSNNAYTGGQQVTYNGDLWTASWWTWGDVPGGTAGDWIDNGPCTTSSATGAPASMTSSTTSSPTTSSSTTPSPTDTTNTSATSSTTDTSSTASATSATNTTTTSRTSTPTLVPRIDHPVTLVASTTTTGPTGTPTTSGCTGALAWQRNVAYTAGQQVIYNGHLWTATWWTYSDVPGVAGVWTDNGTCVTSSATVESM